ncbi:MAG: hypothetical protein ACOY3Z_00785 [Thermodesulfobacteriota bacterium]
MTQQPISEVLHELDVAAKTGKISEVSTSDLNKFASALCHSQAYSAFGEHEFHQICETVRLHLLRAHVEALQNHITGLNKKNSMTQYCVVALTVFSIIFGAIQVYYARESDIRAREQLKPHQQEETRKPIPSLQPSTHNLQGRPLPGQATLEKGEASSLKSPKIIKGNR